MGSIISGVGQVAGSLIGGGARRDEQRAATAEFQDQKQAFQDFQFQNTYAGLENVAEDLTVNQQASQFQAQQTDAALAQSMQAAIASGGAPGGAQAIAQAALQSKAGISADLAKQEQANELARTRVAMQLQQDEAAGADVLQTRQYDQSQQLLTMAADRKQMADAAREQATQQLVGGLGDIAGGVATAFAGGAFDKDLSLQERFKRAAGPKSAQDLFLEAGTNYYNRQ